MVIIKVPVLEGYKRKSIGRTNKQKGLIID